MRGGQVLVLGRGLLACWGDRAEAQSFQLTNFGDRELRVRLDLTVLYPNARFSIAGCEITKADLLAVTRGV